MLAVSRKLVATGGQHREKALLHHTLSHTTAGPGGAAEDLRCGGWASVACVETGIAAVIFGLTPTHPPHTPLVGFSSLFTHPSNYFRRRSVKGESAKGYILAGSDHLVTNRHQ